MQQKMEHLHMFFMILHNLSLQFWVLGGNKLIQGEVAVVRVVFLNKVTTLSWGTNAL